MRMGTREEIKSFLLPTRIGTACPFNTHDVLFIISSWNVEFLNGMSDFNRFRAGAVGFYWLVLRG